MRFVRLDQVCDSLLAMLDDSPREDPRLGKHAATLLEELVAAHWDGERSSTGRACAEVAGFAQTAMDGFERWFGPQALASEDPGQYRAAPDVELEIRSAIASIRGIAHEQLSK
jgi:hypothetical protein